MSDLNIEQTSHIQQKKNKPFWFYLRVIGIVLLLSIIVLVIGIVRKVTIISANLANQTSNSATIVWLTDKPALGKVELSENEDFSTSTNYYDDRDLEETGVGAYKLLEQTKRDVHHVTMRGLAPEKIYYYRIINNENGAEVSNFKTPKINDNIVSPDPVYGKLTNQSEGVVMLKKLSSEGESQLVSTVLSNGTYSLDGGNLLDRELVNTFLKKEYIEELWVLTSGPTTIIQVKNDEDQPVQDIQVGLDRLLPYINVQIQAEQKFYSPNPAHQDNCCNIESRGCKSTEEWSKGWNECAVEGKCGCVEKTANNNTNNNTNTNNNGKNVEEYDEPCEKNGQKGTKRVVKVCGPDSTASSGTGCTWGPGSYAGECIVQGGTENTNNVPSPTPTPVQNTQGCTNGEVAFGSVVSHQAFSTAGKYCGTNDKALYQCNGQCCKKIDACSNGCYFADAGQADRCCIAGESDTDTRCSSINKSSDQATNTNQDSNVNENNVTQEGSNTVATDIHSNEFKFKFNSFYLYECTDADQSKSLLINNISTTNYFNVGVIKNISSDGNMFKLEIEGKTGWVKKLVFVEVDKIEKLNLFQTFPVDQCINSDGTVEIPVGVSQASGTALNDTNVTQCPTNQCYHKGEKRCMNVDGKGKPEYQVVRNPQNNKCVASYPLAYSNGVCQDTDYYEIADEYCKDIPLFENLVTCGVDQCADAETGECQVADGKGTPDSPKRHQSTNQCQGYFPVRNIKLGICEGGGYFNVDESNCINTPMLPFEDCTAANKCRYSDDLQCVETGDTNYYINSDSDACKKRERIKVQNDICKDIVSDVDMSLCNTNNTVQTQSEDNLLDPGSYKVEGTNVTTKEFTISEPGKVVYFQDLNGDGVRGADEPLYNGDVNSLNIQFNKVSEVQSYNMNYGWNLVSFPIYMRGDGTSNILKASDLITQMNSGGVNTTHIVAYRSGKFITYSNRKDESGNPVAFGEDFSILPGEGYFVRSYSTGIFIVKGKKIENGQQIALDNGWNMVGIYNSGKLSYKGFEVLKQMNGAGVEADILSKWENGLYQNVVLQRGKEYGSDYGIYPYQGYFVRVKNRGSGVYTPQ
jgi:hypothetical protein